MKKKNSSDHLQAYSQPEAKGMLASKMAEMVTYWSNEKKDSDLPSCIEGLGHSIGATLDGCSPDFCSVAMALIGDQNPEVRHGFEIGLSQELSKILSTSKLADQAQAFTLLPPMGSLNASGSKHDHTGEDQMLARWRVASWRWQDLAASGGCTDADALSGFAMSVASVFEGSGEWRGIALGTIPHKDDKAYSIAQQERYFKPLSANDPIRVADFGGEIKTQWVNRWASDQEVAKNLRGSFNAIAEKLQLKKVTGLGKNLGASEPKTRL